MDARDPAFTIRTYHAHIYFRDPEERERALRVREWIDARFAVQLGRVHDVPVGPHSQPMYQVAFTADVFAAFVPFLLLNRLDLSVLVHPNTGRALDDHVVHALWLGERLAVRSDVLSNDDRSSATSPVEPNTAAARKAG